MRYLLDSGILIRLVHPSDAQHVLVSSAVRTLNAQGHTFYCGMQNVAEFWNVSTRPSTARSGLGVSLADTKARPEDLERTVTVLTESLASYAEWKRLVVVHGVSGVQVHDTRLAALMSVNGIGHLLTLNPTDFKRFPNVVAVTPREVVSVGQNP